MTERVVGWAIAGLVVAIFTSGTVEAADKQLRPYVGTTFGGFTTIVDPENGAATPNFVVGISWVTLGDMFGFDADLADAPGFFQAGDKHLVLSSRVTTLTGNLVIAAPRRLTEYVIRPYLVAGGGVMRVHKTTVFDPFTADRTLPAFDIGGGAIMFLTDRLGFSGEVRRFQNIFRQTPENGLTLGDEQLSFWRGTMSFVYRY